MCIAPWTLASSERPASGNQAVIQPEQEQQHAADEVEMRMRGAQQEVLAYAHHDAGDHADQQYQRTHAHHQRSDHLQSFAFLIFDSRAGSQPNGGTELPLGKPVSDLGRRGLEKVQIYRWAPAPRLSALRCCDLM
jgi:hypothetical protein